MTQSRTTDTQRELFFKHPKLLVFRPKTYESQINPKYKECDVKNLGDSLNMSIVDAAEERKVGQRL